MRLIFAVIRPPLRSADFGVQLSLWDAERGQLGSTAPGALRAPALATLMDIKQLRT
jgi:hypothetical protein